MYYSKNPYKYLAFAWFPLQVFLPGAFVLGAMASNSKTSTAAAAAVLAATMTSQESMDQIAAKSLNNFFEKAAERHGGEDVVTLQNIKEVISEKINVDKDPEKVLLQAKYDSYKDPPFDFVEAQMLENKIKEAYIAEQNLRDRTREIELFKRDCNGTLAQDVPGGLFRGTGFENIFAMEPTREDLAEFRAQLDTWTRAVPESDPVTGAPLTAIQMEDTIRHRVRQSNDLLGRLQQWSLTFRDLRNQTRAVDPALVPTLFSRSRDSFLDPSQFPRSDRVKEDRQNKVFTNGKIAYYDHPTEGKIVLKYNNDVHWKKLVEQCTIRDDSMDILNVVESIKKLLEMAEKRGFTKDDHLKEFMYQFLKAHFKDSASLVEHENDPDEIWKILLSKHRPDQNYKKARYAISIMYRSAKVPIDEFAEIYINRNKKVCYHQLTAVERSNKECLNMAYKQADKMAMFGLLDFTLPEIKEVIQPQLAKDFLKQKEPTLESFVKQLYDMEQTLLPKKLKEKPDLKFYAPKSVKNAISDSTKGYNVDIFAMANLETDFANKATVRSLSSKASKTSSGSRPSSKGKLTKSKAKAKLKAKKAKAYKRKKEKSRKSGRQGRSKTPSSKGSSSIRFSSAYSMSVGSSSARSSSIGPLSSMMSTNSGLSSGSQRSNGSKGSGQSDGKDPYKDPEWIKYMDERKIRCLKCFNIGERIQKIPPNHGKDDDCFKYRGPVARKNCPKCKKGLHYIPSGPHKQECQFDIIVKKMREKVALKEKAAKESKDSEKGRLRRDKDGQLTADRPKRSQSGSRVSVSKEKWAKIKNRMKKQKSSRK